MLREFDSINLLFKSFPACCRKGRRLLPDVPLWIALCVLLGFTAPALAAPETAADGTLTGRNFVKAVDAYEAGDYPEAVRLFSTLAESGIENGMLYFNLGNAYFKVGDLGRSLLWYERASLLLSKDADLRFNLELARGLTQDEEPEEGSPILRALFFWNASLGARRVQWLALFINLVLWGLWSLRHMGKIRMPRWPVVVTGTVALLLVLTALGTEIRNRNDRRAVVVSPEVVVRSTPAGDSTELFRLHEGARVRLDHVREDGVRIRFSKERLGWVPIESVEPIRWKPNPGSGKPFSRPAS